MKFIETSLVLVTLCAAMSAQQISQSRAVNEIEDLRAKAERTLGDYERVLASRDAFTLQLQQAVGIDDKVLIQRAVSDIGDNRTSLNNVAGQLDSDRKRLMEKTSQELLAKNISETMYVYQLDFSRQIDHLLKEAPNGLLLGLLIDAHKKAETSFVYSDFIQEKPAAAEERASAKTVQ